MKGEARKVDRVLREILHRVYERNEPFMSQKSLAQACELSMDTVNRLVAKLNQFRSIEKKPLGFRVADPKKGAHILGLNPKPCPRHLLLHLFT